MREAAAGSNAAGVGWQVLMHGFQGAQGPKICRRIVVCCPTSLVFNWNNEIKKWLKGKVSCIAVGLKGVGTVAKDVADFCSPRCSSPICIISYETFRNYKDAFYKQGAVDMLICDEAHRLKNDATQTSTVLAALETRKRVLLSGTPLQNRLDEFYAMANFCNPGVLGTPVSAPPPRPAALPSLLTLPAFQSEFRRTYERPILAGMEPDATDKETERAREASQKLSTISNQFILRRTNALLAKHLPTKIVEVVCCKPTPLQVQLYNHFIQSKAVKKAIIAAGEADAAAATGGAGPGAGGAVLGIIQSISKLCNHPRLVHPGHGLAVAGGASRGSGGGKSKQLEATFTDCTHLFPDDFDVRGDSRAMVGGGRTSRGKQSGAYGSGGVMPELSGKMAVLDRLLGEMRSRGTDRIVIVSNFTQTLDQIQMLCRERFFPVVRLDGSMAVKKRRVLVEDFNDMSKNQFVFLLSSKAGGCGLNLIGANRLVLFDPDWNPATDKQAAARVWRDGQKKRCYVYRFFTAGTIEEKVYQRQMSKEGLQSIVCDDKMAVNDQTNEDLRNIFQLETTPSSTHDSLKCTRCQSGVGCGENGAKEDNMKTWAHHFGTTGLKDKAMVEAGGSDVSFIFSMKYVGQKFPGFHCEDDTDGEGS